MEKIKNPLTGRMIDAKGQTAKVLNTKIQASKKLQAIMRRQITTKPVLQPPKKYGWEDLDEDVKGMISKFVKPDNTFEKDKILDSRPFYFPYWAAEIKKRLKPDINSKEAIDYIKEISKRYWGGGYFQDGYPVPAGLEVGIQVKTYTRKQRVEKLSDLSEEELDERGGIKFYPLLCLTIDLGNKYDYLEEDHFVRNPPKELWIRGINAETLFKKCFLFPDGEILIKEDKEDKETLFGNNNLKIKWDKVDNKKFNKDKSKYLPNFQLPTK
jgi:hypothetical protein